MTLPPAATLRRLLTALGRPVSNRPLVAFRILFGSLMLWEVTRYFHYGWIDRYYVRPRFHFTYFGFGWVAPWPGAGMYLHFAALGVLAAAVAAGLYYRAASTLFFVGFTYVFLLDQAYYLNHFYLIALLAFLLPFVPANEAWSLDALRRPDLRSDAAPAWSLGLLRFQVAVPYVFGALAKVDGDWLRGEPMRAWLGERRGMPLLGALFDEAWIPYFFSYAGLLVDLLAVPLLLMRRTVFGAFAVLAAFHLLNAILFRIGVFPWLMLAATVALFWPLRAVGPRVGDRPLRPLRPLPLVLLVGYLGVQILAPLRHLVYPGDADWTEEGHRFSWHMKLRDKSGQARFLVTDPGAAATWEVDPAHILTPRQIERMRGRPDMVLQFAHYLAADLRAQGFARVEVRAEVMASLNGRPPQLLIDPSVDLVRQPRSLRPAPWIVPLHERLPRERGASSGRRGRPPAAEEPD